MKDDKSAIKWYTLSAEQGLALAQRNLGLLHARGLGTSENFKNAIMWWTLAAEQNDEFSQYNLALMYGRGLGVSKDYATAHMWATISSGNGHEKALEMLETLESNMTIPQIRNAKNLFNECTSKNYINC